MEGCELHSASELNGSIVACWCPLIQLLKCTWWINFQCPGADVLTSTLLFLPAVLTTICYRTWQFIYFSFLSALLAFQGNPSPFRTLLAPCFRLKMKVVSFFLDVSSRLPCLSLGFESGCITLDMLIDNVNFLPIALLMKKGKRQLGQYWQSWKDMFYNSLFCLLKIRSSSFATCFLC